MPSVYSDDDDEPNDLKYIRVTKSVNMYPYLTLTLKKGGVQHEGKETIKLCLVDAKTGKPPDKGDCQCDGTPILTESQNHQLYCGSKKQSSNELFADIENGYIEFQKLRIGCCTGTRGHRCLFAIQAEFTTGIGLKGLKIQSLPIEVRAKRPQTGKNKKPQNQANNGPDRISSGSKVGDSKVLKFLTKLNLQVNFSNKSFF